MAHSTGLQGVGAARRVPAPVAPREGHAHDAAPLQAEVEHVSLPSETRFSRGRNAPTLTPVRIVTDAVQPVIDCFVNVRMGSMERPPWLVRVAEDYFKRSEQIFKDISISSMLDEMDRLGVAKAIIATGAENPNREALEFVEKHPAMLGNAAQRANSALCTTR